MSHFHRACVYGIGLAALFVAARPGGPARAEGEPEAPKTTLQDRLSCSSIGRGLERARVRPFGWVELMLSASPGTDSETRTARVFDVEAEGLRLHQAYVGIERTLSDGTCWDVGGKIAGMYGTDSRLTHARGLLDDQTSREQFDLLDAHVLVRAPIGYRSSLTLKAGKCTTPMGAEVIEAPNNLLPSRSFQFGFAIPFTHVGAIATLQVNKNLSVGYGRVLGWDVWDDNNDSGTNMVMGSWTSPSGADTLVLNGIWGPERLDNDTDVRAVLDGTWTHTWSTCWKTMLNLDVGTEEGAGIGGTDALWWGAAGYVTRTFNDKLSSTLRAEYFRDRDGARLGTPVSLTELTLGLDWKPFTCFPNLRLRPEVRWDHSLDGVYFDDATDDDQFSLILDVLVTF